MTYGVPRADNPAGYPLQHIMFYPHARVLRVYGNSTDDLAKRGKILINYMGYISDISEKEQTKERAQISEYQGQFEVDADPVYSYGFKPTTEEAQSSTKRRSNPMNQQYGLVAPPRRGDVVLAMQIGDENWLVLGAIPARGGNEQPAHHECDLSFIHRSGASIRFNDHYPSSMTDLPTDDYDGITGHVTLVGNRVMWLSGSKWLSHGLLADHEAHSINIELNEEQEEGKEKVIHTYADVFDNSEEPSSSEDPYYAPWADDLGDDKFLKPPEIIEGFAIIHEGGGLFRFSTGGDNHSHMKVGARGVTIYAGQKYWNAGLMDESTHDSPALDSTVEDDVIKILHHSGAYIKIDANGKISIVTANGQNYEIIGTGGGTVLLGESADRQVIGHGDPTDYHVVMNAFGIPSYGDATGHKQLVEKSQDEVWIP